MLEESRNVVLTGQWSEKSAGGCHLNDKSFEQKAERFTWVNNPKFLLKVAPDHQVKVKITLSRPEKVWKKQMGVNTVGCMIGFYIYAANEEPTMNAVINREGLKFVPWNEISEELIINGIQY